MSAPSDRTYGICSVLSGEAADATRAMWDRLEHRFGLRQAGAALHPHVTYLVGECSRPDSLAAALTGLAPAVAPLAVTLDGLGVFPGDAPTVFLQVTRSDALVALQARVLTATRPLWDAVWPHYLPEAWVPHVTLALGDLPGERLPDVLADLERRPTRLAAALKSLDLVHMVLPRHAYLERIPLGGAERSAPSGAGGRPR